MADGTRGWRMAGVLEWEMWDAGLDGDQGQSRLIKVDQGVSRTVRVVESGDADRLRPLPKPPRQRRCRMPHPPCGLACLTPVASLQSPRTQARVGTVCSTRAEVAKWNYKCLWLSGIKPSKGGSRLIAESELRMRRWRGDLQRSSEQFRLNPGDGNLRYIGNCSTTGIRQAARRVAGWVCRLTALAATKVCGRRGVARSFADNSHAR